MTDLTEREYRQDVLALAHEAFERTDAGEDEHDVVHELVDASEWVLKTYMARHVAMFSKQEEMCFEVGGDDVFKGATCMAEVYTRCAYYAMAADVMLALQELQEEAE